MWVRIPLLPPFACKRDSKRILTHILLVVKENAHVKTVLISSSLSKVIYLVPLTYLWVHVRSHVDSEKVSDSVILTENTSIYIFFLKNTSIMVDVQKLDKMKKCFCDCLNLQKNLEGNVSKLWHHVCVCRIERGLK